MRLLRDNVGAFKEDLKLETSAAKLAFIITTVAATFDAATFNKMKCKVSLVTRNRGEKTIYPEISLRRLFCMSAVKEGFFVWGAKKLKGYIDLGANGSLLIEDGDYISVSYDGFPADAVTNIYALDVANQTTEYNVVEEISINGTSKDITVADKSDLYLPLTDSDGNGIDQLQLEYAGGRTVTYSEEELKVINDSVNDVTCVVDENLRDVDTGSLVRFGFDDLLWLDVTNALRIKVTPKTKNPVVIYTGKAQSI